jgi:hypothetical protein
MRIRGSQRTDISRENGDINSRQDSPNLLGRKELDTGLLVIEARNGQ